MKPNGIKIIGVSAFVAGSSSDPVSVRITSIAKNVSGLTLTLDDPNVRFQIYKSQISLYSNT